MCSVIFVSKCVVIGRKAAKGGDLEAIHQMLALILGAAAGFPLVPPVGAGVAPTTPTPLCFLNLGGPSAMWHFPWRGRTRL